MPQVPLNSVHNTYRLHDLDGVPEAPRPAVP